MKLKWGSMIIMLAVVILAGVTPVFAHEAVYDTATVSGNRLKVTLKWSNPKETRGIQVEYYYLKNGKTLNIGYKAKAGQPKTASVTLDLTGALPPVRVILNRTDNNGAALFKDIGNNEAQEYIHHLHDAGITDGSSNGCYKPKALVTRAEFATMLSRALKLSGTPANTQGLKDINHWAKKDILRVCSKGLMSGYADKTFRPNRTITVAEVSTVIARAFPVKTLKDGIYDRLKTNRSYSAAVKKMFDAGILTTADGIYQTFNEESPISRQNLAMMLSRALCTPLDS